MNRPVHAAFRGAVGAMAMSGMRELATDLKLIDRPPPQAIFRERIPGLLRSRPSRRRRAAEELAHWAYGAAGGAVFGLIPLEHVQRRWSGPVYGLALWLSFEAAIAPALGLGHSKAPRPVERLTLAADHVLYGLVLSEMRTRPREDR